MSEHTAQLLTYAPLRLTAALTALQFGEVGLENPHEEACPRVAEAAILRHHLNGHRRRLERRGRVARAQVSQCQHAISRRSGSCGIGEYQALLRKRFGGLEVTAQAAHERHGRHEVRLGSLMRDGRTKVAFGDSEISAVIGAISE